MPSWKKVITSGSDAALNSLNVTTSLTASGNIYPTGLGVDRQILKTDGAGNISFGYAEEIVAIVKNVSGGTLQKGTPVHATASGASGNVVGIIAASASDASTMPATFVLNETLNDDDEGEALSSGFIQGVNTAAFEVGQIVYVGESGGYTGTKPIGSNLIQNLGVVTKVDLTNGSGYILGAGRSNDLPNIQPGYVWVGNDDSVPTPTATSSIQNVVSASYAATASYVNTLNQIVRVGNDIELDNQIGAVVANSFDAGSGNVFIDGLTGEVTATTFIGDLTGTASYAAQALSASWAPAGNPFPYTGSAEITGSLGVTGSFSLQTFNGLTDVTALDFGGVTRVINDVFGSTSINADDRELYDSSTILSTNWEIRRLIDTSTSRSVDWENRYLQDTSGNIIADWSLALLLDTGSNNSVDWQNRQLKNSSGNEVLNWSSGVAITGSLTVSGSSTFTNIGPAQFSGSFGVQGDIVPGFPPFIPDTGPYDAIKVDDVADQRLLYGTPFLGASASLDFGNRILLNNAGSSVLSWDGTVGYIDSELYSNSRINATTRNTLLTGQAHAGQTLDEVTFDSTVADFDLVYLSTGSTWFPVDQATDSSTRLLGICLGYDPGTGLGTVILEGDVSVSASAGSAPVVDNANYGLPVYIASGSGNTMDTTIPVDGYVRVLGHCYHNDGANKWIMKFRPSNDWIEI